MDIKSNRTSEKYTTQELVQRVLWMLVGQPLFKYSFRISFGWRRFILRLFGSKIGNNVNIYPSATIYFPWNIEIGDWSSIGEHAYIYNLGKVTIGESVTISQHAHICAGTHDYNSPTMPLQKTPVTIHDNVWVCADAFVGPNVTLHKGAVVGARAVVCKDVESLDVVAGNPARTIKKRNIG